MNFDCGPEWQPWKFWCLMMNEFNTIPSAIQTYGDFCDAFERIARNAENEVDSEKPLTTIERPNCVTGE